MPDPKDQPAADDAGESKEPVLTMHERIDKGFEEIDLLTEQENAAKAKADGQPAGEKKDEPGGPAQKPYKILKVQGKEIPVKDEAEYDALAQKGLDYTKKTQTLAEDRRGAEAEAKKEADRLADAAEAMNEKIERLIASGVLPRTFTKDKPKDDKPAGEPKAEGEISAELAEVYARFQLDPANAYPHEKKLVEAQFALERRLMAIEDRDKQATQQRANALVEETIAEERKAYPFDDIRDDQGNDVTRERLKAIIATKMTISGVERPTADQMVGWIKESVHDIHVSQKGNGAPPVSDDADPEEFAKTHPGLVKKLQEAAVAKALAERTKHPPTLTPGKREFDPAKKQGPKAGAEGSKSFEEYLDRGFKDPDVLKALSGGE